jgi:hypothetical protein
MIHNYRLEGLPMKQSELLGVLLKTIGTWSLVNGVASLPQAFLYLQNWRDEQEFLLMTAHTFAAPVIVIAIGLCLVRATDWFVGIALLPDDSTTESPSADSGSKIFGVVLKAMGCLEMLNGISRVPYEIARAYRGGLLTVDGIACSGILIVTGCFLVFSTDWCLGFAYRKPWPR